MIDRFCKKHGYVECPCAENMGLSLKEYQLALKVIEAVRKHVCSDMLASGEDLSNALQAYDKAGGQNGTEKEK